MTMASWRAECLSKAACDVVVSLLACLCLCVVQISSLLQWF